MGQIGQESQQNGQVKHSQKCLSLKGQKPTFNCPDGYCEKDFQLDSELNSITICVSGCTEGRAQGKHICMRNKKQVDTELSTQKNF